MNKEEILEKSRKENLISDEMQKDVERREYENSFIFLQAVLIVFMVVSSFQKYYYGKSFASYNLFAFLFFIGAIAKNFTRYYYYKRKKDLILGILMIILACSSAYLHFVKA